MKITSVKFVYMYNVYLCKAILIARGAYSYFVLIRMFFSNFRLWNRFDICTCNDDCQSVFRSKTPPG